jgi:hypothetical protein
MFSRIGLAALCLALTVLLSGCGKEKKKGSDDDGVKRNGPFPQGEPGQGGIVRTANKQVVQNHMRQIGLAFHNFCDSHPGKGPAKPEDLLPFLENDAKIKEAFEKGLYVLHWHKPITQMTQGTSKTIVASEKEPDAYGNRVVVLGDASPKTMNKAEYEKTLQAQGN